MPSTTYLLMNKNRPLLSFYAKEAISGYHLEELETFANPQLFPPRFNNINTWISNRNYAKHKEHLQKWLHEWGIDNTVGFIELTHALSLNDSLWVKPETSSLTWEQVNLYTNDFTDVVSVTAFETGLHELKLSTTSPEFTSEGSFEKCWIKETDGIYLYKKGSSGFANAGLEAYSEYYASQLSGTLCRSFVPYELVQFKKSLVSRCKMFTTENEGFIPIYKFLNPDIIYNYDDLLAFCATYHCEEDFRRMIILDAIIFNVDRHLGNFGFIVDNDTFRILRFAPVFDHNMALLARAMQSDLDDFEHYYRGLGHKIDGEFVDVARKLLTPEIRPDVEKLTDFSFTEDAKYNLPPDRLDFLTRAVRRQISGILN